MTTLHVHVHGDGALVGAKLMKPSKQIMCWHDTCSYPSSKMAVRHFSFVEIQKFILLLLNIDCIFQKHDCTLVIFVIYIDCVPTVHYSDINGIIIV
jgi:hypothetical protein